jgi:hypothetical protein
LVNSFSIYVGQRGGGPPLRPLPLSLPRSPFLPLSFSPFLPPSLSTQLYIYLSTFSVLSFHICSLSLFLYLHAVHAVTLLFCKYCTRAAAPVAVFNKCL